MSSSRTLSVISRTATPGQAGVGQRLGDDRRPGLLRRSWRPETLTLIDHGSRPGRRAATRRPAGRPRQDPRAERPDQAGGLGQRDELGRRDHARASGAASGPGPRSPVIWPERQVDGRLVVQTSSPRSSARAQVGLELRAGPRARCACRVVEREAALPAALARYMARSALRSSWSASVDVGAVRAMPMLPLTWISPRRRRTAGAAPR